MGQNFSLGHSRDLTGVFLLTFCSGNERCIQRVFPLFQSSAPVLHITTKLHLSFPKLPFILCVNIVPSHSLEGGFAGSAFTLWFIT